MYELRRATHRAAPEPPSFKLGQPHLQNIPAAPLEKQKSKWNTVSHSRWKAVRPLDAVQSASMKSSVAPNVVCRRRGELGGLKGGEASSTSSEWITPGPPPGAAGMAL